MAAKIRKPTEEEAAKIAKSQELSRTGMEDEKDVLSKMLPTMRKEATNRIKAGKDMRESIAPSALEYDAYQNAGYKKGGKVGSASKRADGIASKGKTKGRFV